MSLIYQALRQIEQRDAAPAAALVPPAPVQPPVPQASAARPHPWLWGAAGVLLAGLGAGLWLGGGSRSTGALPEATVSTVAPPLAQPSVPDDTGAVPVPAPELPRAQAPLPTTRAPLAPVPERPPVRQEGVAPVSTASSRTVTGSAVPLPAPAERASALAEPVPEKKVVAAPVDTLPDKEVVAMPAGTTPTEDMRVLFDRFNRALSARDHAQARQHLDTIQAALPASSVARWRAEAWFSYQTGELERARDAYRGLLDKLPGDENATLSLVAIEQRLEKPGPAREVLEASLRHNPNSAMLRTALDRLQQSEAGR